MKLLANIQCQIPTMKTSLHKKIPKHIPKMYVSIFLNCLQIWRLVYRWKIYLTLYIIFSDILFNNNMMKISYIYISIVGYLLQVINIRQCREHISPSMLDHPDFNYIPIDTYVWEMYSTFMLSYGVYITHPLNWVKV